MGPVESQSEADIVEKLVERVTSSTLIDDRRDACRALKSLSKKYRVQVGAQGMSALIDVLRNDRSDCEFISYALDTLSNIIYGSNDEDGESFTSKESENIGIQFTEIYLKQTENVKLLLDILEDHDLQVKWGCVKLLTFLLINKPKEVQDIIISSPNGVSRLMENLSEKREIIRNDTLYLLVHLTKGNANMQKIVAFQNAFDILFEIIKQEGYCDGGIVVEDAVVVMHHLLKNNASNQVFFKEGSFIQKLSKFFDLNLNLEGPDKGWSDQRRSNIELMLQVTRLLVCPSNPQQLTSSCQKIMNQCGLLEKLCELLMANGVPVDVLTNTIITVADIIRGHHNNQEYFSTVKSPTTPPRPAIVVLLMSMMNEKQPFILRCAVLYCFQCFLHKNEFGQAQIVQTLLPSTADISTVTAGQLLCGGLFVSDPLSNWFATVALSHALVDNTVQKEQLLRVQLSTGVGNPPISLLKQCCTILQQAGKPQVKIGLLMLLSTWLSHCKMAVAQFLDIPTNIPYLSSQVSLNEADESEALVHGLCAFLLGICIEFNDNSVSSFTREDLCQLIIKRVKVETFVNKLNMISKHESFCKAARAPHVKYNQASEVLYDFEFCRLFKSLEGSIITSVQPKELEISNEPESNMTTEQLVLLQQYKEVIRNQDQLLCSLKDELQKLETECHNANKSIQEMTNIIQQLKDQNALLKARNAFSSANGGNSSQNEEEYLKVKQCYDELKAKYEKLQHEVEEKSKILEKQILAEQAVSLKIDEERHAKEEELLKVIKEQSDEISNLKLAVKNFENQLETLQSQNSQYQALLNDSHTAQVENETVKDQLLLLQGEQEDLHVLIADQCTQLSAYRQRLKELGEQVSEDDEDDLDLTEFDEEHAHEKAS